MTSPLSPFCVGTLLAATLAAALGATSMLLFFSSHQCQLKEPSQPLPLPSEGSVEDEELPAQRYERDLVQKLKVLRHELSLQQPQAGHCRIEVSREEIFEVRGSGTESSSLSVDSEFCFLFGVSEIDFIAR